jgi:heparin binding hemagglutinin HbhA
MSVTSDVKGYADAAVEQGKQVVDLAQARLAKSANEAAKLADLDAVKGTVGGYLAQAKSATGAVAGKADELVNDLKKDPRVARALDEAELVAATVVETMKEKVVAPALTLLGRRPAAPSRRTPRQPTKAAGPKRTTTQKTAAASKAPARKSAATKAPATKAPATKGRPTTSATAKRTPAKPTQS